MEQTFQFEKVTYREAAPGWVEGVYYPREMQVEREPSFAIDWFEVSDSSGREQLREAASRKTMDWTWKLHSRVWQEIEETGFGIYYYEETTRLVTTLSGSNYRVKVTLSNPTEESYSCHIRVNGIVKEAGVELAPGEKREVTFTACMTDGEFALTLCAGRLEEICGEILEGDIYVSDIEILPEEEKQKRKTPRIFLVSDSTVQSYEKYFYPQTGWGQMLHCFFKGDEAYREYPAKHCDYSQGRTYELPGLVIENRSIGGRSARSFYDEGKLDQVLEVICPGDYMFVQFAHNDATAIRPNRYIAPEDFPYFLQRYVDACARRGVQLVFVTPVTMLVPEEDGSNKLCFAEYREQMMKLAQEKNIPLLDLSGRSNEYVNEIGHEAGKQLYLWLEEGEYPNGAYANGVSDKCHLQEYGAKVYANMVAQMILEYAQDARLDALKELVSPVAVEKIPKPLKKQGAENSQGGSDSGETKMTQASDAVTGFVAQEISVEGARANFLLNWNPVEGAVSYHIYGKRREELTFIVVRTVTRAEKEASPVLPFVAEAGALWQYYVTAVFENGSEGQASRTQEVDLRK